MYELIRTYQMDIMLALSTTCMLMAILLLFTKYMLKRRKWILFLLEIIAAFLLFLSMLIYNSKLYERTNYRDNIAHQKKRTSLIMICLIYVIIPTGKLRDHDHDHFNDRRNAYYCQPFYH